MGYAMPIAVYREDGLASSTAMKGPCKAATTAAVTLVGEQTIDGVACVTGDRVLVKNQASSVQNGIYVVDTGNWRRSTDFEGNRDVRKGTQVYVHSGEQYGWYRVETADPVVIDSSAIAFQFTERGGDPILPQSLADPSNPASIDFHEATANGANRIRLKGQDSLAADRTLMLPDKDGTLVVIDDPDIDGILFWDDSEGEWLFLTLAPGLVISGTEIRSLETWGIALSNETAPITTGAGKVSFSIPYEFKVVGVYATLSTASTLGTPTFDVNEEGASILGTKIVIDANELTGGSAGYQGAAAGAATISDDTIAAFATITWDIDVAGTGAKGAKGYLIGYRNS